MRWGLGGEEAALQLDAPVEDAVSVHLVDGLHELVEVDAHALLGEVVRAALDELVDVAVHELKDEREAPRGLVVEHLVQLHDVVVLDHLHD